MGAIHLPAINPDFCIYSSKATTWLSVLDFRNASFQFFSSGWICSQVTRNVEFVAISPNRHVVVLCA